MSAPVDIRPSLESDAPSIFALTRAAFGAVEGPEIEGLIRALWGGASARPLLSLVAVCAGRVAGHVLFSAARLSPPEPSFAAAILAPLGVHPDFQRRGVGGRLVLAGLERLADAGVDWVFVLGHPGYYPRFGFAPAGVLGFAPHHPIAEKNADAWMARALRPGVAAARGRVVCADALADPQFWAE